MSSTWSSFLRQPTNQTCAFYRHCLWQQLLTKYREYTVSQEGTSRSILSCDNPSVPSQVLTRVRNIKCIEENQSTFFRQKL